MRPKYDMLWKGMLEEVMEDFLRFVEPDIGEALDLGRGFEFLDKELAEMYPEPEKPSYSRVVDKLAKVFLRDGAERWMLIHIEVQGGNLSELPRRMFEYFIRLFGKYGRPVAAIAVLTGKDRNKIAGLYEDGCLWMKARYEYKTVCILNYTDEELKVSMNPFAAVLLVAKEALLRVKADDPTRDLVLLEEKTRMVMLLEERMAAFGERKVKAILTFLNNYVVFKNPEINGIFMDRANKIFQKRNTMGIIEQLAEIKYQEGVEEGMEKGLKKAVRGLLANTEFSSEKIARLVDVPVARVRRIKKELNGK